ncbi:MAG: Na+/H+ antiporter NhaA, partial [Myxococcales bacterium]|nr:Na+/H+ antiporter NhaA [Polyangiaceae bacterium]MDW8251293.1 Na+/H+ antiporter NhaA [Myxococcales bacterium]
MPTPEDTSTTPSRTVPRLLFAVVRPFRQFFRTEAASGITLMAMTAIALLWANSRFGKSYEGLLHLPVTFSMGQQGLSWPLHHWINDALMSVFFLVVGMEIKRELLVGELRTVRQATLPALAALGGMLVPAAIHLTFNRGSIGQPGWGVPMATDIAFALGCLALVANRVPSSLVVFLMALAIFDDLGAILVIAFFYGGKIHPEALLVAGGITGLLMLMARLRVTLLWPFLVLGVALWGAVLKSGIHATIAGVILGLCIPARGARRPTEVLEDLDRAVTRLRISARGRDLDAAGPLGAIERHLAAVQPPLDRMVRSLHPWVAFGIVPLFALANAGVAIHGNIRELALSPVALGASLGLSLGKPLGIFGVTWLAVTLRLAPRPTGATWIQLLGVSVLAGIGFTMSIFVATLAFPG